MRTTILILTLMLMTEANACGGLFKAPPPSAKQSQTSDEVALNPQPLPPGGKLKPSRGDKVGLNPQPLPPAIFRAR